MSQEQERVPLATAEEVAAYLRVPLKTLYNWHQKGTGPRMARVGRNLKARWSDVDEWLQERTTSGAAA